MQFTTFLVDLFFLVFHAVGTIDMNLQELQYVADHLHPEECRKLFASMHFKSYELPDTVEQAENQVSKDVPCVTLLLHWNSAVGEGRGETHEVLEHRLRQMGKHELADWLGKTVFHQLTRDLVHAFSNVHNLAAETTTEIQDNLTALEFTTPKIGNVTEWYPIDTILFAGVSVLCFIAASLLVYAVWRHCCKRKKRKTRFKHKKKYKALDEETLITSDIASGQ